MKRRTVTLGLVAGAATAAGLLWNLRQEWTAPQAPTTPLASLPPTAGKGQADDFWAHSVERVDGSPLPLASLRGQALIVNFWATWCPPCVREMPLIDRFHREQQQAAGKGWRILGLAIDRREAVAQFLAQSPVSYDVALAGLEGTGWSRALGNAGGGLPFTVAFGQNGQLLYSKLGELSEPELRSWRVPLR